MDMSLREWLILIGAVILIGILLDGYRRMLRAKKDSLEISRSMGGNFETTPLDDNFNPELPNGGARIIPTNGYPADDMRRDPEWDDSGWDEEDYHKEGTSPALQAERDEPDFDVPDFDQELKPEKGEPVRERANERPARFPEAVKVLDEPVAANAQPQTQLQPQPVARPQMKAAADQPKTTVEGAHSDKTASRFGMMASKAAQALTPSTARKEKADAKSQKSAAKQPQEIIIINVFSKEEGGFSGLHLRKLVEACGMEYGEMSVFNRHEHDFGEGPVQFGMANLVEPGTFDLRTMDESYTPGVCFFLSLPGPDDSMKAFEYMLETAQCVVRHLNGDMKDERRSVFTQQTIEHCRQRIREFERRQQLAARV